MKKIDAEQQATNGAKNPSKMSEEFLKVANIKMWSSVSKGAGVGLIVGSILSVLLTNNLTGFTIVSGMSTMIGILYGLHHGLEKKAEIIQESLNRQHKRTPETEKPAAPGI